MSMSDLQILGRKLVLQDEGLEREFTAALSDGDATRSLDLGGFFRILRQQWQVIALLTALLVGVAAAYSVLAPSVYTASSKILINPQPKRVFGNDYIPQDGNTNQILIESQTRVIASNSVLARVVESERLYDDPDIVPVRRPGLVESALSLFGFGTQDDMPVFEAEKKAEALRHLQQVLTVKRPSQTYIIEVEVSASMPDKAARLSRAVSRAYIADQAEAQADSSRQVSQQLQDRLAQLRSRVIDAENRVQSFKALHNIVSANGSLVNERQLGRLGDELGAARERVSVALAKVSEVRGFISSGAVPESIGEAVNSRLVTTLREQYARASRRVSQLASVYGSRHPQLIAAQAEASQARRSINEELRRIGKMLENELKVERRRVASLEARIDKSRGVTDMTNKARVELAGLERDANATRAVYERLLSKARETTTEEKLNLIDARIISYATAPLWASWPKKKIILPLAMLLGLGFGVAGALANDYRRDRFTSLREVEELTGLPVLGTLPQLEREKPQKQLIMPKLGQRDGPTQNAYYKLYLELAKVGSTYATAVMALVRNLETRQMRRNGSSFMLVSSNPEEGSSAVAWSAAINAAMQDKRVLLIDGDGGTGDLAQTLAPGSADRIQDVVAGRARLSDLVVEDKGLGLSFLAISPSRKAQEKVSWLDYQALLGQLSEITFQYDLVFIDGGAISNSGLAHMLVDHIDQVALVLDAHETSRADVGEALQALGAPAGKMCGVVVTLNEPETV